MNNKITTKENDLISVMEGETNKTLDSREVAEMMEIEHSNLLKKIDSINEDFRKVKINFSKYWVESTYKVNGQKRDYKNFRVTKMGCEFLAHKTTGTKGNLFTAKYMDKFEQLQQENKELKSDNKELYTIATSDKDQEKREYKANIIKFGWKNIRVLLADCTYKNIEDAISEIMDFHVNKLKKKDRSYSYSNMSKTEYKQAVRGRIDEVLDNIYNTTLDGTLRTVVKELQETTLRDKIETTNRKNAQELNKLKQVCPRQIKLDDYIEIHKHPFAKNYMYEAKNNSMYKTYAYRNWINTFPNGEIADIEYWEDKGVDFDLTIKVYWRFVTYNGREFDTDGLIKAVQDQIFNRVMQIDDSCIDEYDVKIIGKCNAYEDGKIYYYIENVQEV